MHIYLILVNSIKRGENMLAKDIMTRDIVSRSIDASIYEIAKTMKQANIGFIPVHKNQKIMGVITDRDIVTEMISNQDLQHIDNYIHTSIITANEDDTVEDVLQKMKQNKVKRIIIVTDKKMVGIVSLSDIIMVLKDHTLIVNALQNIFSRKQNCEERITEVDAFYL